MQLPRGVLAALVIGPVLAGIIAAVIGARAVANSDADESRLAFRLTSAEIASTLTLAIQHEEDLVVSASAFVTGNPKASPADFDRWAQSVHAMARYPELQNIGLVKLVPASGLAVFRARLAANPVRALGPGSAGAPGSLQIVPEGSRPYYCLAVAGMARSAATYLPAGLDYCALSPPMINDLERGLTGYAPVSYGPTTMLGVETPVYRGGTVPPTVAARRRLFVGWLGELIIPNVLLAQALHGHPNIAARFSYDSRYSHAVFTNGTPAAGAQHAMIPLREGWTVQSYGPAVAGGVLSDRNALALLVGGILMSLLFGLLILVFATGRLRALSLVRQRTRELSQKTEELSRQALHDALTGLANRALVRDRAEQMLARTTRQPGVIAGALFIDVDGFKRVNDRLGHAAGDQLLKVVAERLRGAAREQDTVGRLGGDEFVVLVECRAEGTALSRLADRLTDALREPIEVDDGRKICTVTASIGVAGGHYTNPDALLRDADLALYAAKDAGKDRYEIFDASMYSDVEGRAELEAELGPAIRENQMFLLYQPIFELPARRVAGVEALVRWRHPERGVMSPETFIPLAEESGIIVPLGRWVLREACGQAARWAREGVAIGISVNVSAYQLGRRDLAGDVRDALAETGLDPSLLTLEITETTLMRDVPEARERLQEVRALGVRIAIDDFGTGYASLSNLHNMPVDIVKIDRSFVAALDDDGRGRELLEAILGVGQALSLTVVAEGIEHHSQLATLEEFGCQMAQGYLLARPAEPSEVRALAARAGARSTATPTLD